MMVNLFRNCGIISECEDPYSFLRIFGFILVTWLLSSFEDTDSEIQVITSVIILAEEIQLFCVVLMLTTGVQWGNTCRWVVLCYAEKAGLHVVAYYGLRSANDVDKKKPSVYSWSNRKSTIKSWEEMYYFMLNQPLPLFASVICLAISIVTRSKDCAIFCFSSIH